MMDTGLFALMHFCNHQSDKNFPILRHTQLRNTTGFPQKRNQPESFNKNWGVKMRLNDGVSTIKKRGKLPVSHRYNRLPLLPSDPGGIQQELVAQDLPQLQKYTF